MITLNINSLIHNLVIVGGDTESAKEVEKAVLNALSKVVHSAQESLLSSEDKPLQQEDNPENQDEDCPK